MVGIPQKTPEGLKGGVLANYVRDYFDKKYPEAEMEKLANSKVSKVPYHDLPESADDSFFLCRELVPGYLDDITGVYQTPQGYYVRDCDVEEFDKEFPPKKKLKLPGQLFK